jgi:hypothetical protein
MALNGHEAEAALAIVGIAMVALSGELRGPAKWLMIAIGSILIVGLLLIRILGSSEDAQQPAG